MILGWIRKTHDTPANDYDAVAAFYKTTKTSFATLTCWRGHLLPRLGLSLAAVLTACVQEFLFRRCGIGSSDYIINTQDLSLMIWYFVHFARREKKTGRIVLPVMTVQPIHQWPACQHITSQTNGFGCRFWGNDEGEGEGRLLWRLIISRKHCGMARASKATAASRRHQRRSVDRLRRRSIRGIHRQTEHARQIFHRVYTHARTLTMTATPITGSEQTGPAHGVRSRHTLVATAKPRFMK